jgi:hypothetical protein
LIKFIVFEFIVGVRKVENDGNLQKGERNDTLMWIRGRCWLDGDKSKLESVGPENRKC